MSSRPKSSSKPPTKDVFKATTNKPLRFAILGPHQSSKSSFVSIISNQISLPSYYPTLQNSPLLVQFQPKRFDSRAILDVHVTPKDLAEVNLLSNKSISMSPHLLKTIDLEGLKQAKNKSEGLFDDVLEMTRNYYNLDYTVWDMFESEYFKPINSFSHQIAATTSLENKESRITRGIRPQPPYRVNSATNSIRELAYKAPVSTPILVELIDTPGVHKDDMIPFLERSLDCRLSKDVLNNLANDYNTNFRSRVKPLITASGISDLNSSIDGYLICYSSIPESGTTNINPPGYDDLADKISVDSIEILESLYVCITQAWNEWTTYHLNWEIGKEYDSLSISTSFKQMWKRKELPLTELKDFQNLSPEDKKRLEKFIIKSRMPQRPPIVIACTNIDSPFSSPLLIEKGRELAGNWGCSFVEMSCSYEVDKWVNVEETMSLLIREAIDANSKH